MNKLAQNCVIAGKNIFHDFEILLHVYCIHTQMEQIKMMKCLIDIYRLEYSTNTAWVSIDFEML